MPWFPEINLALERARQAQVRSALADPVGAFIWAAEGGDPHGIEGAWPVDVVVHDPRDGRITGHQQFKEFVKASAAWLGERQTRAEPVATTAASGRIVVELLAHLVQDGRRIAWPFAVVAEPSGDGQAIQFRSYYSQWPLTGRHHQRDPILPAGAEHPSDVVAEYQAALAAGDAEAIVAAFEPDGSFREPSGPQYTVRGTQALREFFTRFFSAGGGIGLEHCTVADDGTRCALEYNCVRWGSVELPPQAGVAVYERGPSGRLAAARVYDDVQAPVEEE
jgi:SnoaL-like domain